MGVHCVHHSSSCHCRHRSSKSLGKAVPEADVHENGYDSHAEPADAGGADTSPSDSGHSGDIEAGELGGSPSAVHSCILLMAPDRAVTPLASYLLDHKQFYPTWFCMQCMLHSRVAAVLLFRPMHRVLSSHPASSSYANTLPSLQARVATRWRRSRGGAPPTPPNSKSCWTGRCACAAFRPSPPRTSSSSWSLVRQLFVLLTALTSA